MLADSPPAGAEPVLAPADGAPACPVMSLRRVAIVLPFQVRLSSAPRLEASMHPSRTQWDDTSIRMGRRDFHHLPHRRTQGNHRPPSTAGPLSNSTAASGIRSSPRRTGFARQELSSRHRYPLRATHRCPSFTSRRELPLFGGRSQGERDRGEPWAESRDGGRSNFQSPKSHVPSRWSGIRQEPSAAKEETSAKHRASSDGTGQFGAPRGDPAVRYWAGAPVIC
jgi:hypothetical protein